MHETPAHGLNPQTNPDPQSIRHTFAIALWPAHGRQCNGLSTCPSASRKKCGGRQSGARTESKCHVGEAIPAIFFVITWATMASAMPGSTLAGQPARIMNILAAPRARFFLASSCRRHKAGRIAAPTPGKCLPPQSGALATDHPVIRRQGNASSEAGIGPQHVR